MFDLIRASNQSRRNINVIKNNIRGATNKNIKLMNPNKVSISEMKLTASFARSCY